MNKKTNIKLNKTFKLLIPLLLMVFALTFVTGCSKTQTEAKKETSKESVSSEAKKDNKDTKDEDSEDEKVEENANKDAGTTDNVSTASVSTTSDSSKKETGKGTSTKSTTTSKKTSKTSAKTSSASKKSSGCNHNWVAQTHTEQKLVEEAWTEQDIVGYDKYYVCSTCGGHYYGQSCLDHETYGACPGGINNCCGGWGSLHEDPIYNYIHHDAVYKTITVTDGYKCSKCGATK